MVWREGLQSGVSHLEKESSRLRIAAKTVKKVLVPPIFLVAIGYCAMTVRAADPTPSPKPSHPAFERLKKLEGRWSGPASLDQGGKKRQRRF
jgi:hypothetical protein